jgi:transcriptional regulator with XRE-family HTH domain
MRWEQIVGTNIRRLRVERDLSQEEVAHRVEIDVSYLGQIERGRRNPTIAVLGRVADALGVHLTALLSEPQRKS